MLIRFSNRNHVCFQGFVFDMDVVTLDNGKPVTRILAECMPNIDQVHLEMQTMGVNKKIWID